MSDHDHEFAGPDAFEEPATEIALWEGAALHLPLAEVQDMLCSSLHTLAGVLNEFNTVYLDEDHADGAMSTAIAAVARQATATAIFALGMHQRARRSATVN